MITLISHRGNINGRLPEKENSPDYINKALSSGFDVEIDVHVYENKLWLGHDRPDYEINLDFISQNGLWCHAKNIDAMIFLLKNNIHCFWHQDDTLTLTSKGIIWQYPSENIIEGAVYLFPELFENKDYSMAYGICSDFISIFL